MQPLELHLPLLSLGCVFFCARDCVCVSVATVRSSSNDSDFRGEENTRQVKLNGLTWKARLALQDKAMEREAGGGRREEERSKEKNGRAERILSRFQSDRRV